jgi:hypothetical protein
MSAAVKLTEKAVFQVDAVPGQGKFQGGAFVSVTDAGALAGCFFIPASKLREVVSLLQATDTTAQPAGTL